jgi:hypothetical protein
MDIYLKRETRSEHENYPRTPSIMKTPSNIKNHSMDFLEKGTNIKKNIKASRFATNSINSKDILNKHSSKYISFQSKNQLSMIPEMSLANYKAKNDIENNTFNLNYQKEKRKKNRGVKAKKENSEYANIQKYKDHYLLNQSGLSNIYS